MQKIIIHTDGGSRGNPGPAGIGAVIESDSGEVLKEISDYIGETTNNVAEYEALIRALEECKKLFGTSMRDMEVEVQMDSELVVRQLSGIYKVKDPGMKERFARVAKIRLEDAPNMTFKHVYREQNAHADELVNKAIDAAGK
ncbi:MAG TPA: ribonuclease HI family protein [Candidatus Paceibacterota bacterium]|nr:ribonuclease HI family protein [Candidatus Paceibacterota bacterium]